MKYYILSEGAYSDWYIGFYPITEGEEEFLEKIVTELTKDETDEINFEGTIEGTIKLTKNNERIHSTQSLLKMYLRKQISFENMKIYVANKIGLPFTGSVGLFKTDFVITSREFDRLSEENKKVYELAGIDYKGELVYRWRYDFNYEKYFWDNYIKEEEFQNDKLLKYCYEKTKGLKNE